MAHEDVLRCPLCQGQGDLRLSEVIERLGDNNLRQEIERYLAESAKSAPREPATVGAAAGNGTGARDFERDVHQWNPQTPIWRRSPKE